MDTLARTLGRTPRTIQYHLHLLKELGLIEFVERRRDRKGRYLSWVYRIAHIAEAAQRIKDRREKNQAAYQERKRKQKEEREQKRRKRLSKKPTTGNSSPVASNRLTNTKNHLPPNPPKEVFNWFFGKERDLQAEQEYRQQQQKQRKRDSDRRREGYEWLFS
jgi:DNA-binding transcriptional ArsR family regulator